MRMSGAKLDEPGSEIVVPRATSDGFLAKMTDIVAAVHADLRRTAAEEGEDGAEDREDNGEPHT
jgi:hypothetical protein